MEAVRRTALHRTVPPPGVEQVLDKSRCDMSIVILIMLILLVDIMNNEPQKSNSFFWGNGIGGFHALDIDNNRLVLIAAGR